MARIIWWLLLLKLIAFPKTTSTERTALIVLSRAWLFPMILSLGLTNFYLKIFLESKPGKSITLKRVKKKIRNSCRNIDDRVSEIPYVLRTFWSSVTKLFFSNVDYSAILLHWFSLEDKSGGGGCRVLSSITWWGGYLCSGAIGQQYRCEAPPCVLARCSTLFCSIARRIVKSKTRFPTTNLKCVP